MGSIVIQQHAQVDVQETIVGSIVQVNPVPVIVKQTTAASIVMQQNAQKIVMARGADKGVLGHIVLIFATQNIVGKGVLGHIVPRSAVNILRMHIFAARIVRDTNVPMIVKETAAARIA